MSIEIGPRAYAICSVASAIVNESAMIFFQNNCIDMHAWLPQLYIGIQILIMVQYTDN